MSEQEGGKALLTDYEKRWLLRARLLNRLVWAAIVVLLLLGFLAKVGLPSIVFDLVGAIPLLFLLGFMLFVFLNSCPRCEKNFYASWFGNSMGSNAFTSRCMNCGLSWKDLKERETLDHPCKV